MFRTRIKTTLRAAAVAGAVATATMLAPATAANAAAGLSCRGSYGYNGVEYWSVSCSGWHFRAVVYCERPGGGSSVIRFGPWLYSGTSTAYCPSAYSAYDGSVELS